MNRTNEKSCPNCNEDDVFELFSKVSKIASDIKPGGSYRKPNLPVYKCQKCLELFILDTGIIK